MLASLSVAFSDVVIDSVVVERARGEEQSLAGNLQSLCWASASFGSLITSYYSGFLIEHYGPAFVFKITSLFPLLIVVSSLLIKEEKLDWVDGKGRPSLPSSKSEVYKKIGKYVACILLCKP